jgi:UDP-N-acetylmuramate dehydrogenase
MEAVCCQFRIFVGEIVIIFFLRIQSQTLSACLMQYKLCQINLIFVVSNDWGMLTIQENISLLTYNTFGIKAYAQWMAVPKSPEEINELFRNDRPEWNPRFILGGGSNVLFTQNYNGLIIRPEIKGIEEIKETDKFVWIRAGCGEIWDDLVAFCVTNDLGGLENLSNIPGKVGASPVQNIGAYGVEAKDCIEKVELILLKNLKKLVLSPRECKFNYRDSIFKNELKNQCIITHVIFRLSKDHIFKTHYPDLEKELDNYPETTIQYIRKAIITIRQKKLPDPAHLGNAGSFFKNPMISDQHANRIRQSHPTMPVYKCGENKVKLSAAWLIEQCHWKGRKIGKVESYRKQPLVIVNRGGATGADILEYAHKIQRSVQNHFAIELEMEVNIL